MEEWISAETVFTGKVFDVRVGTVRLDTGQTARRDVVLNPGGVAVVPVLGDDILLVRQYRVAIGRTILELPAGRLEPGEAPLTSARRELVEEVGYVAADWSPLVSFYSSPGFADERIDIFLAQGLTAVPAAPEWDERLEPVRIARAELPRRLAAGDITDGKTLIGLYALLALG